MSTIKIHKEEAKQAHVWIKSAIGTPNRRQYPHKNIMYPYFRMYKSPYRARDSRTRKAFWPCVDKYPWHTHQKRWVKSENLNVQFFAEFTNRPPNRKNLFETCHTLPLNGLNCVFWRPCYEHSYKFLCKKNICDDDTRKDEIKANAEQEEETLPTENGKKKIFPNKETFRVLQINNFYYIISDKAKNGLYFYLKYIAYTMRPFRGKIIGDIYLHDKKIRENVSSEGIINGEWKYSFPHISLHEKMKKDLMYYDESDIKRTSANNVGVEDLVIVDKFTYRPPLPNSYSMTLL